MSVAVICSKVDVALHATIEDYNKFVEDASYQELAVLAAVLLLSGADGRMLRENGELIWTYKSLIAVLFPLRCIGAYGDGVDLPHFISGKSYQKGIHQTVEGVMRFTPCDDMIERVKTLRSDPPLTLLAVLAAIDTRFEKGTLEASRSSADLNTRGVKRFVVDCALIETSLRSHLGVLALASPEVVTVAFRLARLAVERRERVLRMIESGTRQYPRDCRSFMTGYEQSGITPDQLRSAVLATESDTGKSLVNRLKRLTPQDRRTVAEHI